MIPVGDRIVVKPEQGENKSKGGILVPEMAKERPVRGTVIGLGTSVNAMVLREGVIVVYGQYSGTEVEVGGEKLLVLREADIFGVVQ
ncbi:MAG: co-chaperone GroES [Gemmatimonadetes bacterium]|nr:co-chaperone GroES [Gemmatimonadota bacterium]